MKRLAFLVSRRRDAAVVLSILGSCIVVQCSASVYLLARLKLMDVVITEDVTPNK